MSYFQHVFYLSGVENGQCMNLADFVILWEILFFKFQLCLDGALACENKTARR